MLMKLLRFFSFSLCLVMISCAVRQAPPVKVEPGITLEEVTERAGAGIEAVKAITDIRIEQGEKLLSFVKASVLIKSPEMVHIRMYQLGMLVRNFVIRDGELYVLNGQKDNNLMRIGRELYNAIFWWETYRNAAMHDNGANLVLKAAKREMILSRDTLRPVMQVIASEGQSIRVYYKEPAELDGFQYPGLLKIYAGEFTITVHIRKLIKNPVPGEADFRVPGLG